MRGEEACEGRGGARRRAGQRSVAQGVAQGSDAEARGRGAQVLEGKKSAAELAGGKALVGPLAGCPFIR
jgi:hypothetical protein